MNPRLQTIAVMMLGLCNAAPAVAMPALGRGVGAAVEWAVRAGGREATEKAAGRAAGETAELAARKALPGAAAAAKIAGGAAAPSGRMVAAFGPKAAAELAGRVPTQDVPLLLVYAERADGPATRALLAQAYKREGGSLFGRITPGHVLASGLTASMLYGTHRATAPLAATGAAITRDPHLAARAVEMSIRWCWLLLGGAAVILLWRHGQMPWHRPRVPAPARVHDRPVTSAVRGPAAGVSADVT